MRGIQDKLDGIQYNDRDFYQEQQAGDRCWKWPLNLAIGLHVIVFAGSIILPGLIERRPLLDDIVTVDLVSMPELSAPAPAPALAATPKAPLKQSVAEQAVVPPPEPEVAEVSVAPEPEITPEPAAPVKPISLKPLKRKIKKAKDTRLAEEKEREQRLKAKKQQALAKKKADLARKRKERAIADARRAQRDAERAAALAREELAAVIRSTGPARPAAGVSGSSGRKVQSAVLNQYSSSLGAWIGSQWQIPEMLKKNRNLKTTVAVTIRRDGTIADLQIEQKSGDPFFDQSVMKALQSASPMPRFPGVMNVASQEFVLAFTPQGLVN